MNNVKNCQLMSNNGYFGTFLTHLTCFLHNSTWTNKKFNNYSFWIVFSDLSQIIYLFWFNFLWQIMSNYLFRFASFPLFLRFKSPIFICFDSFRIKTLKIWFDHKLNHKKHYWPKLSYKTIKKAWWYHYGITKSLVSSWHTCTQKKTWEMTITPSHDLITSLMIISDFYNYN